jgi:hypothetical protein
LDGLPRSKGWFRERGGRFSWKESLGVGHQEIFYFDEGDEDEHDEDADVDEEVGLDQLDSEVGRSNTSIVDIFFFFFSGTGEDPWDRFTSGWEDLRGEISFLWLCDHIHGAFRSKEGLFFAVLLFHHH